MREKEREREIVRNLENSRPACIIYLRVYRYNNNIIYYTPLRPYFLSVTIAQGGERVPSIIIIL